MPGPLANIGTILDGIGNDIDRALNMENETPLSMRFVVPDSNQLTSWRTVYVVSTGWNRESGDEKTKENGSEVIFSVADVSSMFGPILTLKDLHVFVEDVLYSVGQVPPLSSNESQTYRLTCKVRTLRQVSTNRK